MKLHASLVSTLIAAALCVSAPALMAATPAKSAKMAPKAAPVEVLAAASPEQLDAAERTHFGVYACEFSQSIDVGMNPKTPGYVDVKFQKAVYTMKPVMSSTGALRLEDVKGKTLLLQIANKSMLMDVKAGQRIVDSCVHESQREAAALANAPK